MKISVNIRRKTCFAAELTENIKIVKKLKTNCVQ